MEEAKAALNANALSPAELYTKLLKASDDDDERRLSGNFNVCVSLRSSQRGLS